MVRVFLIIGLFLSCCASCSSGYTIPSKAFGTDPTQIATFTEASSPAPTMTALMNSHTPPTPQPSVSATETDEDAMEKNLPATGILTITIVYDNNVFDPRLKAAWGFSALVEYRGHTLLFDTGGDGGLLIENMSILGIDPTQIESVVLSHAHDDHTAGLGALLDQGARPVVYLLPTFPDTYKNRLANRTEAIEVTPGLSIAEDLYTTGEMGKSTPEQALVVRTDRGLVVITGCAHPGIIEILEQARVLFNEPVHLVLGGFHLGGKSKVEVEEILRDFRHLSVERVAPCHCTGDQAIALFAAEYQGDFIQSGVGRVINLGTTSPK